VSRATEPNADDLGGALRIGQALGILGQGGLTLAPTALSALSDDELMSLGIGRAQCCQRRAKMREHRIPATRVVVTIGP